MGRMNLLFNTKDSSDQVEGYCIIKAVSEKTNSKGAPYLDFVLVDGGGEVNAKLWDYDKERDGEYISDIVIKVRGTINLWRDTEQLRIDRIRRYDSARDSVNMAELVPCAPIEPQVMLDKIISAAEGIGDKDLSKLTLKLINDEREKLLYYPAALKLHHAMRGGLLYHTFTMLSAANAICDIYPRLNRDLVTAGVIVHDLAKVPELNVGEIGLATGYSVSGQLIGHITMGVARIECAARELGTPEQTKILLEHIVLSHHGTPEFGSAQYPMFPEAEVVNTVDTLDAKLFEMYDALDTTAVGGFSDRQWALDNRMLYRHGSDANGDTEQ